MKMRETSRDTDKKLCVNNYLTWANQVRLLTVNFQSLAATIGQGLIAAILPALQALNALMAMLQKAALAFRNFIYTLTGYKGQGSQGGIVNEFAGIGDVSSGLGDIGSAGSDAADGLDDAAGSAEKLKKELSVLPFDELNQLQESASASGGSGGVGGVGGGGGGIGGLGDIGDFGGDDLINALGESKLPDAVNEWAKRIRDAFLDHDWERLGKEIAWGINKGFEYIYDAINWKNVGPKITRFTNAFTRTFNSLVNNIDWDLIGRTFGAGINTIVNTLNQLADGINWLNLGRKLSEGINGLFDEIEWENLGHLIGNKFRIAWEIFGGFVTGLDYASIGQDVADGLNGVFSTISFKDIANFLVSALNGAFEFLGNFTKNFNWQGLVDNITNGINEFISKFKWKENGARLNAFLQDLLDSIIEISANVNWNELGEGIGNFLSEIDWGAILSGIVTIIKNSFGGLIDGLDAGGTAGSILSWITKAFILVKVSGPVLGLVGKIATALTGNSPLTLLSNAFEKLFSKSSSSAVGEIGKIGTAAETASKGGISSLLSSVGRLAPVFGLATGAAYMGTSAVRELNKESVETAESTQKLSDNLMDMKKSGEISAEQWEKLYTVITDGQAAGKDASEIFSDVANKMDEMGISSESAEKAIEEAGGSIDNFSKKAKDAQDEINSIDMISLVDQLNSTSDAIETVEFSKMTIEAAEAVDAVGGIWEKGMDGWKQITGSKAIEIYQGIMSGIYSDNGQGYYDIGNGILVSLGQGISGGTEGFKSTLDMSLIQTLQNKLPEGYSIAYENGKVTIDNYRKGIEQNGDLLSLGLTNATIDKINSILPQGMMIAYDNGHMTIQNYASGISGEGNAESVNVALSNATIKQIESVLPEGVTISYNNGSEVIEGFKSGLSEDKSSIITVLRNTFIDNIDFGDELKDKFSGYAALSQKGYTERINALKKDTEDTMRGFANNAVKSPFAKELDINSPSKVFEGFGDNIVQGLANGIEDNSDEPKSKLETLGNTLKKNMETTLEKMERSTNSSVDRLGRSFDSAQRSADNARENIISAFTGIHIPLPHISINWNPIKVGSLSFSIPSFGLNWYAAGGLFSKASVIGVGENGDEAVLPLENKRTMGMIADSIFDNFSGGIGLTKDEMKQAVAEGVAITMMNQQQNRTPINLYATLYTEDNEVLARAVSKGQESLEYRTSP